MKLAIFGAKSIALGVYHAVKLLYDEFEIECFLVSALEGNPKQLAGLPVVEIADYTDKDTCIYIATPETIQAEIVADLKERGFTNLVCIDSRREADLMERYYRALGSFASVHDLPACGEEKRFCGDDIQVYVAKFYRDKQLTRPFVMPAWTRPLQVGAVLTQERVSEILDCTGDHISEKNGNYCELTALYWIWKNQLRRNQAGKSRYYGLFHYRRILDMTGRDLQAMMEQDVDVILPYPMMCEPDISEHHRRYLKEADWQAMKQALLELQPEYAKAYERIFSAPYMYNYNMLIAKEQVLWEYCEWLFPILERTEALSEPKGWERKDRYIGYLGENLLTLYFMYRKERLKIYHTGRMLLL